MIEGPIIKSPCKMDGYPAGFPDILHSALKKHYARYDDVPDTIKAKILENDLVHIASEREDNHKSSAEKKRKFEHNKDSLQDRRDRINGVRTIPETIVYVFLSFLVSIFSFIGSLFGLRTNNGIVKSLHNYADFIFDAIFGTRDTVQLEAKTIYAADQICQKQLNEIEITINYWVELEQKEFRFSRQSTNDNQPQSADHTLDCDNKSIDGIADGASFCRIS